MRKLSRTQLGILVLVVGLGAFALDRYIGAPDVSTAGPRSAGGAGFKGSDEELQTSTGGSGFKGSDEELQVGTSKRGN